MAGIDQIPEVLALDARNSLIRIPGEQDVPVTSRIRQLIDSQPFQRLKSISQLGLVSLVYPGATHTRFEHSLGVYRMALLFLKRLAACERFRELVTPGQAETLIVAALLHDVGHWPYCHPFEDMGLPEIPAHEDLAIQRLEDSSIPEILSLHFDFSIDQITDLLRGTSDAVPSRILTSMLSGPIDVDKMDYLYRDSLHAGVPYGMHYDRGRLIGSLCLNRDETALAITEKGCTAAELMVFARYVMFSEVYWHHTVRAATAMLQRSLFSLRNVIDRAKLFVSGDQEFHQMLLQAGRDTETVELLNGLFGRSRQLYKRLGQFTFLQHRQLFENLARRPYPWLVQCAENLARMVGQAIGRPVQSTDILIDAPPVGLEVQFKIDVRDRQGDYRSLSEVSPVVKTLAEEQFDNFVKRVRVFVSPRIHELARTLPVEKLLQDAIAETDVVDHR